jgi:hypothetical protein
MDQLLTWFFYGALSALSDFQKYIGNMGTEVFENAYAKAIIAFFLLLARGLLIVGVIVAIFQNAIASQNGGGNIKDTGLNILKGFIATELFTIIPVKLFSLSVHMQDIISKIINYCGLQSDLSKIEQPTSPMANLLAGPLDFFNNLIGSNPILSIIGISIGVPSNNKQHIPSIAAILFLIAFLYGFIKVLFDNIKRGGILLVQICVGTLYMFSLPQGYTDGFFGWCKQVIAICFTSFLQNIFLIIGLNAFKENMVFGLGIMLSAAEIPRIAQAFGLDTGMKLNVTSVTMATNSVMNLGRTLMKAGA